MMAACRALAAVAALFTGSLALASDGTITLSGTVRAMTCSVAAVAGSTAPTSGTGSLTLTLSSVFYTAIATHGSATGSTPFTIGVYGCGTTVSAMSVSFDSASGMNAFGVLTNTGTANSIIAFRILNSDNATPVTTGTPNVAAAGISSTGAGGTGGGSQTFYVQYYNSSVSTSVTSAMAGTVVGSVTYTIIYT